MPSSMVDFSQNAPDVGQGVSYGEVFVNKSITRATRSQCYTGLTNNMNAQLTVPELPLLSDRFSHYHRKFIIISVLSPFRYRCCILTRIELLFTEPPVMVAVTSFFTAMM